MVKPITSLPLPLIEQDHPWPVQGAWTYEDYKHLPEDGRRYEIIEGVLYMANAPSFDHQFAVTKISGKLDGFVSGHKLGVVITAPFEVHLPNIAKPVQPDVLFIASQNQPLSGTQIFEGSPDLIVEVLSPGSVRLDQHIKFGAYERAGVREYWIADPKTRSVEVYKLPSGGMEYVLVGQFTVNEKLHSELLAGLEVAVSDLFVP